MKLVLNLATFLAVGINAVHMRDWRENHRLIKEQTTDCQSDGSWEDTNYGVGCYYFDDMPGACGYGDGGEFQACCGCGGSASINAAANADAAPQEEEVCTSDASWISNLNDEDCAWLDSRVIAGAYAYMECGSWNPGSMEACCECGGGTWGTAAADSTPATVEAETDDVDDFAAFADAAAADATPTVVEEVCTSDASWIYVSGYEYWATGEWIEEIETCVQVDANPAAIAYMSCDSPGSDEACCLCGGGTWGPA